MGFKVAFLGLGVMGYPMAGHLAKAGHEVTVYNRSTAKAEKQQARISYLPAWATTMICAKFAQVLMALSTA